MSLKLSVLDQTPIRNGNNAHQTLQESVQLAKLADELGYTRYWISEHHNFTSIAAAAPEVLIARLAAETKRIRFGSGGIMLPNHSALKVAENFRLLEAMYPERIDLGIGRAPGGDRLTASLLNPSNNFDPQEYVQQITDLKAFLADDVKPNTVHEKVKAIPTIDTQPALWMLTSSGESAYIAAHFGLALSFAQFINPVGGAEAIKIYRERFQPNEQLHSPQTSFGIFAFASDNEETAKRMQAIMDYRMLSFEKGTPNLSPSYEEASVYSYSAMEWNRVLHNRQRMAIGTIDVVKSRLTELAKSLNVDEVILATFSETHEDRLKSYQLLASEFINSN